MNFLLRHLMYDQNIQILINFLADTNICFTTLKSIWSNKEISFNIECVLSRTDVKFQAIWAVQNQGSIQLFLWTVNIFSANQPPNFLSQVFIDFTSNTNCTFPIPSVLFTAGINRDQLTEFHKCFVIEVISFFVPSLKNVMLP